jgi:hypothetical protein
MNYFVIYLPPCYLFSAMALPQSVQLITKLSFFSLPTTITLWITHHFISCLPPLTPSHTFTHFRTSLLVTFLFPEESIHLMPQVFSTATQMSCANSKFEASSMLQGSKTKFTWCFPSMLPRLNQVLATSVIGTTGRTLTLPVVFRSPLHPFHLSRIWTILSTTQHVHTAPQSQGLPKHGDDFDAVYFALNQPTTNAQIMDHKQATAATTIDCKALSIGTMHL